MANRIIETNLRPTDNFVSILSRYGDSQIIYYGESNKITFKIYKRPSFSRAANDRFTVITPDKEYRPDLVSLESYGVVDFWYKIMETNKIFDIFDFKAGLTIRIPGDVF